MNECSHNRLGKRLLILFRLLFCVTALEFSKKYQHGSRGCVSGIPVQSAPLRHDDPQSVYSLVASNIQDVRGNFLATQVWPSSRALSLALEQYFSQGDNHNMSAENTVVCELGCGPGLPSLTAARSGASQVFATDIDELGLQLVQEAARQQELSDRIIVQKLDLVNTYTDEIPWADLYVMSDVFENNAVAEGAARISAHILARGTASIWTFAQSDRAPRETYLREVRRLLRDDTLHWTPYDCRNANNRKLQYDSNLWLCDIDETNVFYG